MPKKKTKRAAGPFDAKVGARLRMLRVARGDQVKAVAARIDVSAGHYQRYESGICKLPLEKIMALAELYSVSVGYFFGEQDMDRLLAFKPEIVKIADELSRMRCPPIRRAVYHVSRAVNDNWPSEAA